MVSPRRLLVVALAVSLVAAGGAQAAIVEGGFAPPAHAKGAAGPPPFVLVTFNWTAGYPGLFFPPENARIDVIAADVAGGAPVTGTVGSTATSIQLGLRNGHRYAVTVIGCLGAAPCASLPEVQRLEMIGATRIDATPPSGTVRINGGAAYTNDPSVTLDLAAADPLIDGLAGSSSGVSQIAVDRDGDGAFPCSPFVLPGGTADTSGCAGPYSATATTTLPGGDGQKSVGVRFGDGARNVLAPCPAANPLCSILLGSPILGNASPVATDTIGLDTVAPIALVTQSRFAVERGGSVSFDASTSLDQSPATASGVDPAGATWSFKDGTPVATGDRVSHAFAQVGTFVGELHVRDRAGNRSGARQFAVTVTPAGRTAAGGGSVSGIRGTAAFRIDRMRVRARYVKSRLRGSIRIEGDSTVAGRLRADVRRRAGGRLLGRARAKARLRVGPFARTLRLPARLLPGRYRLAFVGPGGTLTTTLRLTAPREGVIRTGRVTASRGGAVAVFRLAARPVKTLRGRMRVSWHQGSRRLGQVPVASRRVIRAALPAGARIGAGRLRAVLRAGGKVVGTARARRR